MRWYERVFFAGVVLFFSYVIFASVLGAFVDVSFLPMIENSVEPDELDKTQVEDEFIELLNEERAEHGLGQVSKRGVLTEMGESHAENMKEHQYVGHNQPDGTGVRDRYETRGLIPECRIQTGPHEYYYGTENAAGAYIGESMGAGWANGDDYTANDEGELAKYLFEEWMHSEGHREAMLVPPADEAGLGIAVNESGAVWAALELC